MPEGRLLLLAGLMLADRHSSMEDRALMAERELARMRSAASGMVASEVQDAMAELAARAEALARQAEGARDAGSADAGAGDAGKEAGREQQV